MSEGATSLSPFACPSCKGPAPLVDSPTTVCQYCGATFDVPAEYRALHAAELEHARVATKAQALFATLGKPPRLIYRVLAGWFSPAALAVGMFPASFLVGIFLFYGALWLASFIVPINLLDVMPETTGLWASVLTGLMFVWTGTLVGVAGTRKALSLGPLQAAFAAKPPELAGGNAQCRLCGAPLSYGPHDAGVLCAYCRGDNLLRIPESWVKRLAGVNKKVGSAIESVEAEWNAELTRVARFRKWMAIALTVPTVLFGLMFSTSIEREPNPSSWEAAAAGEGNALELTATQNGSNWYSTTNAVALSNGAASLSLSTSGPYCSDALCRLYVQLPARRGETWTLHCTPEGAPVRVEVHRGYAPVLEAWQQGWPGEYGPRVAEGRCGASELKVPITRTGWHLVGIEMPGKTTGSEATLDVRRSR